MNFSGQPNVKEKQIYSFFNKGKTSTSKSLAKFSSSKLAETNPDLTFNLSSSSSTKLTQTIPNFDRVSKKYWLIIFVIKVDVVASKDATLHLIFNLSIDHTAL